MFLLIVNRAINLLFEAIPSRQFTSWGQIGKIGFLGLGTISATGIMNVIGVSFYSKKVLFLAFLFSKLYLYVYLKKCFKFKKKEKSSPNPKAC